MSKKAQEKVREIIARLDTEYPATGPFLDYSNPLELVVATSLSAQCTDERVNKVTKKLFKKYRTPGDYAHANLVELEKDVFSTGFYRNKAKNLKGLGQMLIDEFDGEVPQDFISLQRLPGVAKKTAAIVMSKAFGVNESVAVDTHVYRIARLLGLSGNDSIEGVRKDLNGIVPREDYLKINELMITHGRKICIARRPQCKMCLLLDVCPSGKKRISRSDD